MKSLKDIMLERTHNSHNHGSEYDFEEAEAIMRVLANGAPTNGPEVKEFEQEFCEMTGAKYAFAVHSCAAALHLALIALDLKPEDEIIVPAMTFQTTANIPDVIGCKVVFVDAKKTFNIDTEKIEEKITSRTKVIMPVHMCGQPCEMDPIFGIAEKYNLIVVEDAAHASYGAYKGKKIGNLRDTNDYAAFSFQQSKNLSTLGEGGMLVTNDERYVDKIKNDRSNGIGGLNYRMTDIQAAAGRIQLKKLPDFIKKREENTSYFYNELSHYPAVEIPDTIDSILHTYHLCNILLNEDILNISRDEFIDKLKLEFGVKCIHQYSPPVHLFQNYFREKYGYKEGDFPIAEYLAKRVVTLPIAPWLTRDEIDYCVKAIEVVLEKNSDRGAMK